MSYVREQKKWAAKRRAEFALATALRRIDFYADVIVPEIRAIGEGRAILTTSGDADKDAADALAGYLELEAAPEEPSE